MEARRDDGKARSSQSRLIARKNIEEYNNDAA